MSRMETGAAILNQLRDRIVTGLYFGNWQPGERLPSIRDIADAEMVDRKTAAAAYHHLAVEGLVEIKSRSGVFLRDGQPSSARGRGPMEQMQRRWLKNTFDGGRSLGLDTSSMVRLFQAIAAVEARPLPVVVEDEATAHMIADELRACLSLDARPVGVARMEADGPLSDASMVVTTPYHAARVTRLAADTPVVTATLSLDPLYALMNRVKSGVIMIAVPSPWIADRVAAALHQRAPNIERTRIVVANRDSDIDALRDQDACIFVWPGCGDLFPGQDGDECVKPVRLLSEATIDTVSRVVLDAALHHAGDAVVSRSSDAAPRSATAASAG